MWITLFGQYSKLFYICILNKNDMISYEILVSSHPEGLTQKVKEYISNGWSPVGGHQVVVTHVQNRFRGTEHTVGH